MIVTQNNRPKNKIGGTLLGLLLVFLGLFINYLVWFPKTNFGLLKSSDFCQITPSNLCEGEIVELEGVFDQPDLEFGIGYHFQPNDRLAPNPIYVKNIGYTGEKVSHLGTVELVYHDIPFGRQVRVRGRVVINDKARCSNQAFASQNPQFCSETGFRILISPSAIVTIDQPFKYNLFGKITDLDSVAADCGGLVEFCEDDYRKYCYQIEVDEAFCTNLKEVPNMFLIRGYTSAFSVNQQLRPNEIFQIKSIDYSSIPIDETVFRRIHNQDKKVDSGFFVYDSTGQPAIRAGAGGQGYISLSDVRLTTDGVFYIKDKTIYFQGYDQQEPAIISRSTAEFAGETGSLTKFFISPDESKLIAFLSKVVDRQTDGIYAVDTRNYVLMEFDLDSFFETKDQAEPVIIHQFEFQGDINFLGFDFDQRLGLISLSSHLDRRQPCDSRKYLWVDVDTGEQMAEEEFYVNVGKDCFQEISRQLFVSGDLEYLVIGEDFNNQVADQRPKKLLVYRYSDGSLEKKSYLSNDKLLNLNYLQITGIDDNQLSLVDLSKNDIFYTFNLDKNDFIFSNLEPIYDFGSAGEDTDYQVLTGFNYLRNNSSAKYIGEDEAYWYFWVRGDIQHKLYRVDKQGLETILVDNFSLLARLVSAKDNLIYIIDH